MGIRTLQKAVLRFG